MFGGSFHLYFRTEAEASIDRDDVEMRGGHIRLATRDI